MKKLFGNRKTRAILVIMLAFTLCAGSWYGAYNEALLNSYATSQEDKDAAQKEADKAKEAAEAKKEEAKAAAKKAAEATQSLEDAEARLESLAGQVEQTKAEDRKSVV